MARWKLILCGGLGIILLAVSITIPMLALGYHTVDEGTIGIYYVGGALDDEVTKPGIHYSNPVWTTVKLIPIHFRTVTLPAINTVTKDGIKNNFHDVEVITSVKSEVVTALLRKYGLQFHKTLVADRVVEEIRLFCANHTIDEVYNTLFLDMVATVEMKVKSAISEFGENGITLHHLTIPKPDIPGSIAENYKAVKVQWTEQLVAKQQQKTEQIKKDTQQLKALADAERQKRVLEIDLQKQHSQKEGDKVISILENQILSARRRNAADDEKYEKEKQAEANKLLFDNSQYFKLQMAKSLSPNTKFFFSGENSSLGSFFAKILE